MVPVGWPLAFANKFLRK